MHLITLKKKKKRKMKTELDELDLSKLKVSQLRDLCSEKGMSGYKKLKKQELINLLQQ